MSHPHTRCVVVLFVVASATAVLCCAGDNKWTSHGPYGGIFYSFAFYTEERDIAFASGLYGLFQSLDAGRTWLREDISEPQEMVVRVSPHDMTVIAAGSSIYSSTDRGTTWRVLTSDPFQGACARDLEFDPIASGVVYAVSRYGGVYKSSDGGETWIRKNSGLPPEKYTDFCSQLEIDPCGRSVVYVSLGREDSIYKTTNGGDSWQPIVNGFGLHLIALPLVADPTSSNVLYAGARNEAGGCVGLYKTTDAGKHWKKVCDEAFEAVAIDHENTLNIYGVGGGRALKSGDGGKSWVALSVPSRAQKCTMVGVAVHPKNSRVIYIGCNGPGVIRSQDAGLTWSYCNQGLDARGVQRIEAHPTHPNRICAVTWGDLFETSDGGRHWEPVEAMEMCYVGDLQIHPMNANMLVAAAGGAWISTNGGKTWTESRTPISAFRVALDPKNEKTIFVAGFGSGFAKSADGGKTWALANTGLTDNMLRLITIDPRNGKNLFVGTRFSGNVFKSSDGGDHWTNVLSGPDIQIQSIVVDPTDSRIVYVAYPTRLFMSTDGGETWTLKQGCPSLSALVATSKPRRLFGGSGSSLYVSADGAETWSQFDSNGLTVWGIHDILVDPWRSGTYFLATDRGVFSYTRKEPPPGAPVIEQVVPAIGKAGDVIEVKGRRFGQLQSTSRVLFGGVDAGPAQSWSDTSLRVAVPATAHTGLLRVVVQGRKSNTYEFIVLPASGNLDPTAGPASGGTRVTILAPAGTSGTQFNVLFGVTLASEIRFIEPNIIICTSPPGAGTVEVKVTSSVTSTTVGSFTYQ